MTTATQYAHSSWPENGSQAKMPNADVATKDDTIMQPELCTPGRYNLSAGTSIGQVQLAREKLQRISTRYGPLHCGGSPDHRQSALVACSGHTSHVRVEVGTALWCCVIHRCVVDPPCSGVCRDQYGKKAATIAACNGVTEGKRRSSAYRTLPQSSAVDTPAGAIFQ